MTISDKLTRLKTDFDDVYNKGYEDGKAEGGGDDFIGVKYSDFETIGYKLPHTADARSLDKMIPDDVPFDGITNANIVVANLFMNNTTNSNSGIYAELTTIYMPSKVRRLVNTFKNCSKLVNIIGDLSKVKEINNAFYYCKSLTEIPYMPNLNVLGANSFVGCTGLTSINIYKTLTTFANNAFGGCTNLLDIYVPWFEGEVANAPWGATNATIHYNTEYDENHKPIISEV